MQSLELKKGKISFSLSPGTSPTLLFIHGNSSSSYFWKKQLSSPALKQFTLMAPDLYGHGRSDHLNEVYSLSLWADSIIQLIDALDLPDVILIGHSMGGHIALRVAEKRKGLKGMILIGTTPLASATEIPQAFKPSNVLAAIFSEEIPDDLAEIEESFFNQPEPVFQRTFRLTDPTIRKSLAAETTLPDFVDEVALINKLRYPVGLMTGGNDPLINPTYLNNIAANNFWKNQVYHIPESRHYSHWDNPSYTNSLLKEYAQLINL